MRAKRHAVYSGTRNLYEDMLPAVKSLVANSSVTDVWLLIEDETFPFDVPDFVHPLNMSGQTWFPADGPNMKSQFSYMAMIRACYEEILPKVDKVVQFDVDTVCVDNIDCLWQVDLKGKWIAAVKEHLGKYDPFRHGEYYNAGVMTLNLKQMRADNAMQDLVNVLNSKKMMCVDQDAFNKFAVPDKVVELPVRFNECFVTGHTEEPAVVHFAGTPDWQSNVRLPRREYVKKYRDMSWDEVMELHNG